MILDCDLSQIEWRVAALLSQDQTMISEIRAGQDQHAFTCTELMAMPLTEDNRTNAKIFNFRAIYCNPETGWYGFFMDPKMPDFSRDKWKQIVSDFFIKYHGLSDWHNQIVQEVRRTGELWGPTGRRWVFHKHPQRGGYEDYSCAEIYNYPVQGTAGDIIKLAIVTIQNRRKKLGLTKSKLMIAVHDSIVWDSPDDEYMALGKLHKETFDELPDLLYKRFGWQVNCPITGKIDAGPNWGQVERIF